MSDMRQEVNVEDVSAEGDVHISPFQQTVIYRGGSADQRATAEALIRGPLQRAGVEDRAAEAERLLEDERHAEAAEALLDVSRALKGEFEIVAELYVEQAASALAEAGAREQAIEALEPIVRERVRRYDDRARYDAQDLAKLLPEERQWLADALAARAAWPEDQDAALAALTEALAATKGTTGETEWAAALAELRMTLGEPDAAIVDIAETRERVALIPSELDRVSIELDYLDALAATAGHEKAEEGWHKLLAWLDEEWPNLPPPVLARVWQRRGAALARREDVEGARGAYLKAIDNWGREPGSGDQIREAFFSIERARTSNARWPSDSIKIRPFASRLRGSAHHPVSYAARHERSGLDQLVHKKFPDARLALSLAYSIHRSQGHLYGVIALADLLAELYKETKRPALALRFYVEAGREKEAAAMAGELSLGECLAVLKLTGARWERAASMAALAQVGENVTDEQAEELAPVLLVEATQGSGPNVSPQPWVRAREALARMACAVPDEHLEELHEILRLDLEALPNAPTAARALQELTTVGRLDATPELADAIVRDLKQLAQIDHPWVGERLADYPELHEPMRQAALAGNVDALETLAVAEMIAGDDGLAVLAEKRTGLVVDNAGTYEERVEDGKLVKQVSGADFTGIGLFARFATPETRRSLVRSLIVVAASDKELETTRATVCNALYNLAKVMDPEEAVEAHGGLLPLARGEHLPSEFEDMPTEDPFARFRFGWDLPDYLRSSALQALGAVVGQTGIEHAGLNEAVALAFETGRVPLISAALTALTWVPAIELPLSFTEATAHPDAKVRVEALRAFGVRGALPPVTDLLPLLNDPSPHVRGSLLFHAEGLGEEGSVLAERLQDDRHAFIRRYARRVVGAH